MAKLGTATAGLALGTGLLGAVGLGALTPPVAASLAPATVPVAYAGLVADYGSACASLSAPLFAAQLDAESGFRPNAVSPKGAQGIAQFMPTTWAVWGIDADGDGHADPFDPTDAIASAARYDCSLARDVHTVPGDATANMLAAYNAGPYAVIRAGGLPPYPQTRVYVKRILALEPTFAVTSTTAPVTTESRAAITFAYDVLGTPYEWGGTGTDGRFDCSGLTQAAYAAAGVTLPRTSRQQWYAGPHIPRNKLQPGDLVFYAFNTTNPATIHHVGLYVGHGYMIDAPYTGAVIRFDSINQAGYIGAIQPST
jgi:cell wall-associated NlpC family hydrolase